MQQIVPTNDLADLVIACKGKNQDLPLLSSIFKDLS